MSHEQIRMTDVSYRSQRQMLQWITALEKVAASSHYTGSNRFDSFSPIRLNVAAQWLVDGVSSNLIHLRRYNALIFLVEA